MKLLYLSMNYIPPLCVQRQGLQPQGYILVEEQRNSLNATDNSKHEIVYLE